MKQKFTFLIAAVMLLTIISLPWKAVGQITTFASGSGTSNYSVPEGWTISGTVVGGSYLKFDNGTLTSPEFAPHNEISFTYSVATLNSGTNHPLTIRILNASTNAVIKEETTATPTSSSYINTDSPISLGDVNVAFKIQLYAPSDKGIRLRNYSITGTPAVIATHTAYFSVNESITSQDFAEGAAITFPDDPDDINGKTFVGWVTASIPGTTNTVPSFVNTTTETMGDSDITYYAVFANADGSGDDTYEKLSSNSFDTNAQYVIGATQASNNNTMWYFYSYTQTDTNIDWGVMTSDPENNTPIRFTLSGSASSLVAKDESNNYLAGLTSGKFKMSTTSTSIALTNTGTIKNSNNGSYYLRHNYNGGNGGLRWYSSNTGTYAYFYKVIPGVSYSNYCTTVPALTHTITYLVNNGSIAGVDAGSNPVASGASIAEGATVTLTATPSDGYSFTSWEVSGTGSTLSCYTDNTTTFTMGTADATVTAHFTAVDPVTSVSPESLTGFTYSHGVTPTQTQSFTINGSNLTNDITVSLSNSYFVMSENENTGYSTDNIIVSKGSGTVSDKVIYVRQATGLAINNNYSSSITVASTGVSQDKTVSLSGSVTGYTLTYDGNGSDGGTVPAAVTNCTYNHEITVSGAGTMTKTGHSFSHWNTAANGSGIQYDPDDDESNTIFITGNVVLYAQWYTNVHNVNMPTEDTYGTYTATSSAPSGNFEYGSTITLTYAPASAFENYVATWTKDNVPLAGNTFTMPDADVTITVNVSESYNITVGSPANGSVSVVGSVTYASPGTTISLTATPSTGYNLAVWNVYKTDDESTKVTVTNDQFTMPSYPVMVSAIFDQCVVLPFNWEGGGKAALNAVIGASVTGAVDDYNNNHSPYLIKLDDTGDYIIIKCNEQPGEINIGVKMIGGGNTSSITVQGSDDGSNFTSVQELTISGSQNNILTLSTTNNFASTDRYVKLYFTKGSNVGVGPISIDKAKEKVATPTFSLVAGTYTSAQNVTISCETEDATIYYTTDGSNPTTGSTEYTSAISVDVTKTIKAIAVKEGMANSAIATATYTINIPSISVSSTLVEANATETEGTITVTYNHIENVDSEVLFYEADGETEADYTSWLDADIDNDGNVYYLISDNTGSARTGFIKVHEKNINVYSELITINQATLMITGAISFGSASGSTNINSASVTGDDAMGYTWTITTVGTTSFTPNSAYAQVGSKNNPATSITFTTTLPESVSIADFKAKFGGFSDTEGTITLKVGETTVGTGLLSGTDDVTVVNSSMAEGTTLTVTVTDIEKGVKCYYIDYTILSYDIYGSTEITNFTIPKGETLTIHDGAVLTITNSLTNEGTAANLVIEDGGQLITKSSGVNATVKKNVEAASTWGNAKSDEADGWYFIASPVDGAAFPTGSVASQDIYQLDWAANKWLNLQITDHSSLLTAGFQRGTGYLYASKAGNTLSVAGEIKPLTAADTAKVILKTTGWNLIGNPLTCKVTVDCAFSELVNASAVTSKEANSVINPCQGIAVYGDAGTEVTFTKAATQDAVAPSNNNSLQMTLAKTITSRGDVSTKVVDNAVVSFKESKGMPKFNMIGGNTKLFIPQDDEEYSVVFSDRQGDVPLYFKANETGTYTISFAGDETNLNGIYLIDILAEEEIDLSVNPSYTFIGSPADRMARFKIVFRNTGDDGTSDIFAYQNGNDIIVSGEGELQIFDVMGRMVSRQRVNGVETVNVKSQGVYIFRLNDKTQKIVVR